MASLHELPEQFYDSRQKDESSEAGMWIFLGTEILFFGVLFCGYIFYRNIYHSEFVAGSNHLDVVLGTLNTAVLLTSSLVVALGLNAFEKQSKAMTLLFLATTTVLAIIFLVIKGFEWQHEISQGFFPEKSAQGLPNDFSVLFFKLYFVMTGLHALHVLVGVLLFLFLIGLVAFKGTAAALRNFLTNTTLYWHFVDIVWIFLFPLLYLVHKT